MSTFDPTAINPAISAEGLLDPTAALPTASGYWRESWGRLREHRVAMVCAGLLAFICVIAVAAPLVSSLVTHTGPNAQDLNHLFSGPSSKHLLGTDELGRDTLTRLVWGARVSLGVGFAAALLCLVLGGSVGLVSGCFGGWSDRVLMRVVDMILAIPPIFLLLMLGALLPLKIGPVTLQHNAASLALIIALTSWGGVARLMRGEAQALSERDFVHAGRASGASSRRIIIRHLLPNTLPMLIVAGTLGVSQVILLEAALDFMGVGVRLPTPSWGNMLLNAQDYFYHSVWLVVLSGALIAITVLAVTILGNAIRDAFDPRLVRGR